MIHRREGSGTEEGRKWYIGGKTHYYLSNGSHQLITVDQSISTLARRIGDVDRNTHHLCS